LSEAEKVACQLLPEGDIIINVVDATNLERNLNLTLQLLEMNKPVVVVLNMWDDTVHKGISIDPEKLSKMLGVPVVTTTGITGEGIDKLIEYIMNYPPESVTKREYKNRWAAIGEIINAVQNLEHRRHTFLERLQDISIHPFYGIPIAILVIIAIFRVIIGIGEYLIGLMEQLFERFYTPLIMSLSRVLGGGGVLHQILIGDISGETIDYEAAMGVLTTGVFLEIGIVLPYILIFYIVLGFLEDLGYLPRLAVLFDRFMHRVGLHGFSIIPMMLAMGNSIIGMQLKDIAEKISSSILIGAVVRNDEIIIPKGDFRIEEGDIVHIVGKPAIVSNFCRQIGIYSHKIKNVMITGGGRISYYLAKFLEETGIKAKIIEMNEERCVELSELLPHTLIINGDGSDDTLLNSENLSEMGAFVSLTDRDEENFMSALLAKQAGVQKVIAKINRSNYISVIKSLGIESVVNPSQITTNHILRYVRGMKNAIVPQRVVSSTAFPASFTVWTALGCIILASSRFIIFSSSRYRIHFIDPPVEPALGPMNISIIRMNLLKTGQRLKSAVA
jgi:Trk K+ transport system NAD-binding subunit